MVKINYINKLYADLQKPILPPVYIDRSDLEAVAVCPHQAQLRTQHAAEIVLNDALPVTGSIVHAIAEEAIKACGYSLQDAADYFSQELPKALGRTDLQPDVLRAGKNLANELRRFATNKVLLCEEQITRSIISQDGNRGEVLITTKPDLVLATPTQNSVLVLDYKSGYKQRTNAEARDAFQTDTICWVLRGKFPTLETIHFFYIETRTSSRAYAKIEFNHIVGGTESEPLTVEMVMQARLFEAARHWIEGHDEAWPEPDKCSMCPVIKWCNLADKDAAAIATDPKAFLDNYIVKQAACDKMIDVMKSYVKDGRIIYGSEKGVRFEFDPKPRYLPKVVTKKECEQ